jgi:hypothetical protein
VEFGQREAGTERADVDAVGAILERQCFGKTDQVRLRRCIQRVAGRRRHQTGERGDIDDASVAALAHAGHEAMAELRRRRDHDLDEVLMHAPLARNEAAGHAVAGIVDEHVDRKTACLDRRLQRRRRPRIGEIGRNRVSIDAVLLAQLARERFDTIRASRGQDEVRSARRERACERGADAGGCAGD